MALERARAQRRLSSLERTFDEMVDGLFNHTWRATAVAAGLGDMLTVKGRKTRRFTGPRFHDLRPRVRVAADLGRLFGESVQHALGHSAAATTLDLYSHLWPGDEDRIRQTVNGALARVAEDQLRTARAAQ